MYVMSHNYIASVEGVLQAINFNDNDLVFSLPNARAGDSSTTSYPYSVIYGVSSHSCTEATVHMLTSQTSLNSASTNPEPAPFDLRFSLHDDCLHPGSISVNSQDNTIEAVVREIRQRITRVSPGLGQSRHIHVFVNPFGGHGKGLSIWDDVVRPMFVNAGWVAEEADTGATEVQKTTFTVTITDGVGHAEHIAKSTIESGEWIGRDVTLVAIGGMHKR